MNIALAQIDMRLGDIEGICSRIESQVAIAASQGVQLLCTPAPLFAGILPGALVDYPNYEHDLVTALDRLAATIEPSGVVVLVPALIAGNGSPLFEVFLLKDGHAAPSRLTLAHHREGTPLDPWSPPVFDIAGTRVAVTFDVARDISELPTGCDLIVFFQVNGFDITSESTAAVASVADGHFAELASRAGIWLACMAPVGGFDEAAYTGGSFVMDDSGRVVAAAPCFEESLLVQEVKRGMTMPAIEGHRLPSYNREEWLWEALRLHLRDTVAAAGFSRAVLMLSGDLPSALLAVLAVDALGPRNVLALCSARPDALTPAAEANERDRMQLIREVADGLHIRLLERTVEEPSRVLDRDVPTRDAMRARRSIESLLLSDTAREQLAYPLSALTKTEAALAPGSERSDASGALAPFGDVYLTELEFLARFRNCSSAVLPARLVSLHAIEDQMACLAADAALSLRSDEAYAEQVTALLARLEPAQVDGVLEAHVDRNLSFEDILLADRMPEAVALLLMLVRSGEATRRRLPTAPVVSGRSFAERAWPMGLAWSDMGRHGTNKVTADDLVHAEIARFEDEGEVQGKRARGEIMGLLGSMLGLTPDQMRELQSDEGQRRMRENMQRFEEQIQEVLGRMAGQSDASDESDGTFGDTSGQGTGRMPFPPSHGPGGFPFFSQN